MTNSIRELSPGPNHYECPNSANNKAKPVSKVRRFCIYCPSPEDREHYEDSSIDSVHTTERVNSGLEDGDDPVQSQRDKTDHSEPDRTAFTKPQPNQIAAAYFKQSGQNKQQEGTHHRKFSLSLSDRQRKRGICE